MNHHTTLTAILITTLLTLPAITATDYPVLDQQIAIRHTHLSWTTTDTEIRMHAAITYLANHKTETTRLTTLLETFKTQANTIPALTTNIALNELLRQLLQTTQDFKTELQNQITTNNLRPILVHQAIQTAIADNATILTGLQDTYWSVRTTNELAIFDQRVQRSQLVLTTLANQGHNTTPAQAILDSISDERTNLQAALTERNQSQIHAINVHIEDLAASLRATVQNLQIPLPQKIHYWTWVGGRAVNRTAIVITELAGLGINITTLQTIQTQAEADYAILYHADVAGNLTQARSALHDLRKDLIALRTAFHALHLEHLEVAQQQEVTDLIAALDDTTSGLTADIPTL